MSAVEIKLQFRRIANALSAAAEVAAGTGHAVTTGRLREMLVQQFLRPHLPRNIEVRSGVIVDSTGAKSKQQDCVLVDTRLPLIDVGSSTDALLIAESVVATIEVKSFLSADELRSTMESVSQTIRLARTGMQVYRKGGVEMRLPKPNPILTYIFAYDGASLETLSETMSQAAYQKNDGGIVPDAICLLKKGVLLRSQLRPVVNGSNVTLPSLKETTLTTTPLEKDALLAFYRRLIDDVMPLRMENIDLDGYYSHTDLE
ncbi:hypothetical protein VXE32_003226 [Burkholderia cepacia]|nr:hypothetical protein [Burkholderia cepacia]